MVATPKPRTTRTRVRISKSGQITLPAHIRRSLGVEVGAQVDFVEERDGTVTVQPVQIVPVEALAGIFGSRPTDIELDDLIREATHEGMERRVSRWTKSS